MEIRNGGSIRERATRRLPSAILLGLAFGVAACGPGEEPAELTCGQGTEKRNGVCVAVVDPIASCGEGTEFDESTGACEPNVRCADGTNVSDAGECVPVAVCGPGTTLDLATGRCLPVASCGPGTVLDDATGRCVSEAACGAGTDLVDGECVAVGVCATGTVLNMDTGLCESHLECGAGQVISGGACVSPNVAVGLEADVREPGVDANDPAYGGTPEPLTLEPIGEKTVFVGNISRPTDFAGNGVLAQDRDVWAFEGVAGQYLRISLLGTGLPQPAFFLDGPRGYERGSPLLSTQNAIREVVLPYTGRYELTVVPTAYVTTGVPVGGANAGYVGVIEELAKPSPATLTPSATQDSPTEVSGDLTDLSDNFFLLQGEAGDAVSLVFEDVNPAMAPAILAFDASGALITHVDVDLSFGDWVGTLVKDGGTTLVVDWQSSTTAADAFKLKAAKVPHAGTLAVAPNAKGEAAPIAIPPSRLVAYTVTNGDPLVLNWTTWRSGALSGPDIQLLPASGRTALLPDRGNPLAPLYAEPDGVRTVFVYNDTSSENDAIFTWEGEPVADLGTLDPATGDEATHTEGLLASDSVGPAASWMSLPLPSLGTLQVTPDLALGSYEVRMYSPEGTTLHRHPNPETGISFHHPADNDLILVQVKAASNSFALDWSVHARALPAAKSLDLEPNDTIEGAVSVGALPMSLIGHLERTGEVDVYRIDVDEPLDSGQFIAVHFENVDVDTNGTTGSGAEVTVQDSSGEVLATGSTVALGNPHANRITYYIDSAASQSSSSFYVHIKNHSSANSAVLPEHRYLLDVRMVEDSIEVEPNDTFDEADIAATLPATWKGHWHDGDELDVFSFILDEALPSDKHLALRFHTLAHSSGTATLSLRDADDNVVYQGASNQSEVRTTLGGLAAGQYFVTITGGANRAFPYRMGVEVIDVPPLETEPNDDVATANDLGVLSGAPFMLLGDTRTTDPDWYRFTLPAPLGPEESVRVRCFSFSSTAQECDIHDLTDPDNPVFLARARHRMGNASVYTQATALGVRVTNTSSSLTSYMLLIDRGGKAEAEPNNSPAEANPLGEITPGVQPRGAGATSSIDQDWYTFSVPADLDPMEHGIWVTFSASTTVDVRLHDLSDLNAPTLITAERSSGDFLVTAPTGATLYGVEIVGRSANRWDEYELTVELGPPAELEPNDTSETANDLGALPASTYGQITSGEVDMFNFTLDAPLGATEAVEVRILYPNQTGFVGWTYTLRRGAEELDSSVGSASEHVLATEAGAPAGTYEVEIRTNGSGTDYRHYRVDVRVVDTAILP